jgi:hypothetical protein
MRWFLNWCLARVTALSSSATEQHKRRPKVKGGLGASPITCVCHMMMG